VTPAASEWDLPGAEGETVLGVTDAPEAAPRASVLLLHGHKGYLSYGCYPVIADRLARALPVAVHRFNASHSGMTRDESTFERPDLFALDTWNKQVDDLRAVIRAARAGELPGTAAGLPVIAMGHSRGGVTCLLAAGREGEDTPDAVVSMSAPSWCASDVDGKQKEIAETGRLSTPSARTGQDLGADPVWLEEQLADPKNHDLLALCRRVVGPTLVIHGEEDETIPVRCAREIAEAVPDAELALIAGGDHVFSTPNPADVGAEPSEPLTAAVTAIERFVSRLLS